MGQRIGHRGFTLLELVLVMVIICTALGVAAPSLRGWSRGSRLRDAADQFVAVARLARTQAVTTSRLHRLSIAASQYQLTVQQGEEFVPLASDFGRIFELPEGFQMQLMTAGQAGESCIDFYPTGRTQPARVRVISDQAEVIDIECASPAETFQVVPSAEGMR